MTELKNVHVSTIVSKLPKVELHVHLDGSMRPKSLWEIAKKRGIELEFKDEESFKKACVCKEGATLPEFLEKFAIMVPIVQGDLEAIERVAFEFCEDKASEGVVYAEARYAPHLLISDSIKPHQVVEAVNQGFQRGKVAFGVDVRSLLCCMRRMASFSPEVIQLCIRYRDQGVVGIDLAGDETIVDDDHPDDPLHIQAFKEAVKAGIGRTVHAAESGPAGNAKAAVEIMGATRIGHGYHILDRPDVYNLIKQKQIHLEICPTSSLQTGAVKLGPSGWPSHPLVDFYKEGLNYSVNTDDPTVCGVNLLDEFNLVSAKMLPEKKDEFVAEGIKILVQGVRNAAKAAFLAPDDKEKLVAKIEEQLKKLGID